MKTIEYGFAESRFGELIVARTTAGICNLQFVTTTLQAALDELYLCWGHDACITENHEMARDVVQSIFEKQQSNISLDLCGTAFQLKVWKALQQIPFGKTVSYCDVAHTIGQPTAIRAVASAIARNPVAIVIPCHRVVHSNGSTGQYHWGAQLKKRLIQWEHDALATAKNHTAHDLL
jgi:methylated-DNA--[protein]-cysteine S-methyltransferase